MRLESAMYASREGLSTHGTAISVIGDNVSNTNTVAYKASRVEFSDIFAEGGNGRSTVAGDPTGSGSKVSAVRQVHEPGTIEPTGRGLDVAIDGRGYFQLGEADDISYSRAGNFVINAAGDLVNQSGLPLLGLVGDATTLSAININNIDVAATPTSAVNIGGNINAGTAIVDAPANPQSFTELGQAATSIYNMTVYDSLGQPQNLTVAMTHTGANAWNIQAYMDGAVVGGEEGVPTSVADPITMTFQNDGTLSEADQANAVLTATPAYSNGAAAGNFTIDLSNFTQFSSLFQVSSTNQDGTAAGSVQDFEFGSNGELFAVLDTQERARVATVQLATFTSEDGLAREGNNLFGATADSGAVTSTTAGTGGVGSLVGGALERSTVDISNEFVNMTVYQRGYQANSQAFSVATQLIQQTIGLIR